MEQCLSAGTERKYRGASDTEIRGCHCHVTGGISRDS